MRNQAKMIIGFGSMWGLIAFGFMVLNSFDLGSNDTAPEVVAVVLYGLTVLPACIVAIWYHKVSAVWLLVLSFITAFGFIYQVVEQAARENAYRSIPRGLIGPLLIAVISGIIGILLRRIMLAG